MTTLAVAVCHAKSSPVGFVQDSCRGRGHTEMTMLGSVQRSGPEQKPSAWLARCHDSMTSHMIKIGTGAFWRDERLEISTFGAATFWAPTTVETAT